MNDTQIDLDNCFDDDYLHFYEPLLAPEDDAEEASLIADLCGVVPSQRILDLGCGVGRITNQLSLQGFDVVGIDATQSFIDTAKNRASALSTAVDYQHGDMRSLGYDAEFDAVFCWFTTFGYFDDTTNRDVLAGMFRAVKPGGRILIESLNLFQSVFEQEIPEVKQNGDDFMIDHNRYDPETGRVNVRRAIIRDAKTRHVEFFVRLFSYTELRDWLTQAGFVDVRGFGGEAEDFAADSSRMIITAQRPI